MNHSKIGIRHFLMLAIATAGVTSINAFAVAVPTIYAANSCNALGYGNVSGPRWDRGTFTYQEFDTDDQGLDAGVAATDGTFRLVCPITRVKVGSALGAKFFMFVSEISNNTETVSCTLTSRRPNGALVSTGTRTLNGGQANANNQLVLQRSISPSSTFGHYSLECETNDNDPRFQSYQLREF